MSEDRRIQLLLIAFAFGAFFEGAAGFGTPVAVTGAILIGLGFSPLAASGLSLIANTAPVAYGALGTPVITLAAVTGLDVNALSAMVGRQLPFFSLLVPFWLIWAFAGWRGMIAIWPAILVTGVSFAIPQFLISNYHGPMLVDVGSAVISMACLVAFLKFWKPKQIWTTTALKGHDKDSGVADVAPTKFEQHPASLIVRAWIPWLILSVFVFAWGFQGTKNFLDGKTTETITVDGQTKQKVSYAVTRVEIPITSLHEKVEKVPPVVPSRPRRAKYNLIGYPPPAPGFFSRRSGRPVHGLFAQCAVPPVLGHDQAGEILAAHHLGDAGPGIRDPLLGTDATMGLAFAHTACSIPSSERCSAGGCRATARRRPMFCSAACRRSQPSSSA